MNFQYVLPGIFSDDALEKFFGQSRQRSGGNFYIDVVDINAADKIVNMKSLIKYDIFPANEKQLEECQCSNVSEEEKNLIMDEFSFNDTTNLLESDDLLKHKIVYIAGHLAHKYKGKFSEELYGDEDEISCEFLKNLDRGGLSVPTFSMVHFVYVGYLIYNKTNARCYKYLSKLFSSLDAPIASAASVSLANIMLNSFVLNASDREIVGLPSQEKNFRVDSSGDIH